MNIYVEHDAAAIAKIAGAKAPHCDGVIIRHGKPDEVLAATYWRNPLAETWLLDLDLPGNRVVTWSGSVSEDLWEAHPMNWMEPGHAALAEFCDEIDPQLRKHDWRVCFHPHHRHVLSDAHSCTNFLSGRKGDPFEIALAPASLLTPSMLKDIEDHLARMFEALGSRCAMVILGDVRRTERDGEAVFETIPLGEGVLPRDTVKHLMKSFVPHNTPVVISAAKLDQQLQWLR